MTLKIKSVEIQPVSIALAKKFRDMSPVRNERPLQKARAKMHAANLMRDQFFTAVWGRCHCGDTWYRGNGNHTSNLVCACMQAHNGGLDDKSKEFYSNYLGGRGGAWNGSVEDLPEVGEGTFQVMVETFEADNQSDLVEFFKRYDPPMSSRTRKDVVNIYIAEHDDLFLLNKCNVKFALVGVIEVAKRNPAAFRLPADFNFGKWQGTDMGAALKQPEIKQLSRWIVENVADVSLYKQKPGATLIAEMYLRYGEDNASKIVDILDDQIESSIEPGKSYYEKLTKVRGKSSPDSLLAAGRRTISIIAKSNDLNGK